MIEVVCPNQVIIQILPYNNTCTFSFNHMNTQVLPTPLAFSVHPLNQYNVSAQTNKFRNTRDVHFKTQQRHFGPKVRLQNL